MAEHLELDTVAEPEEFAPGAALRHGRDAWVLLDQRPAERLGAAIAWSLRAGAEQLHVIADAGTGVLARRAAEFAMPITIWHAEGRSLWPAVAEPIEAVPPVSDRHRAFAAQIAAAGADVVDDDGVVAGEVRGLEVCRVVDDADTGEARLAVGVGANDREAFAMLHGDTPETESLARIVRVVAEHRQLGADPHPLNRLGHERLLRSELIAAPGAIGAERLWTVAPPVPRANLKDPVPCVAAGVALDGDSIVVVCSTGIELDLIPYAADARLAVEAASPGTGRNRLIVVTPRRDRIPVTVRLAELLCQPASLLSLD